MTQKQEEKTQLSPETIAAILMLEKEHLKAFKIYKKLDNKEMMEDVVLDLITRHKELDLREIRCTDFVPGHLLMEILCEDETGLSADICIEYLAEDIEFLYDLGKVKNLEPGMWHEEYYEKVFYVVKSGKSNAENFKKLLLYVADRLLDEILENKKKMKDKISETYKIEILFNILEEHNPEKLKELKPLITIKNLKKVFTTDMYSGKSTAYNFCKEYAEATKDKKMLRDLSKEQYWGSWWLRRNPYSLFRDLKILNDTEAIKELCVWFEKKERRMIKYFELYVRILNYLNILSDNRKKMVMELVFKNGNYKKVGYCTLHDVVREIEPESKYYKKLADIFLGEGEYSQAVEFYKKAGKLEYGAVKMSQILPAVLLKEKNEGGLRPFLDSIDHKVFKVLSAPAQDKLAYTALFEHPSWLLKIIKEKAYKLTHKEQYVEFANLLLKEGVLEEWLFEKAGLRIEPWHYEEALMNIKCDKDESARLAERLRELRIKQIKEK